MSNKRAVEVVNGATHAASVAVGDVDIGTVPRGESRALRHFEAVAEEIVAGWLKRKRAAVSAGESAHGWFKRNIYRLIRAFVLAGRESTFSTMAKRSGRSLVGVDAIADNPFKLALFAMWADNESLSRHQQRVFGSQMLYAHLHDVEPEHLLGFIRLAGSAQRISKKLSAGAREPGFPIRSKID